MNNTFIQNIYVDENDYHAYIKNQLDDFIIKVLESPNLSKTHKINIFGIDFNVEFHERNDYLGHTLTYMKDDFPHYPVDWEASKLSKSIVLYTDESKSFYDAEGLVPVSLLIYSQKKDIYVVVNDLMKMEVSTGLLSQIL